MAEEDKGASADGATPTTKTPEYATKAELQALTQAIEGLKEGLSAGKGEELDPTDQEAVNRLYNEMVAEGKPAETPPSEDADPTSQRLTRMEKNMQQMMAVMDTQYRTTRRAEIDAEFGAKYEDWGANKADIWKLAKQHPTLDGDQVYVLWKLGKHGPEGLTKKEQKTATEAVKASEEAKAAASEKPGASSAGKTREAGSLGELLRETWENMPAKPVFK